MNVDAMEFGFAPGRGTSVALFVARFMQEENGDKRKSCMCVLSIHLIEFRKNVLE